MAGPEASARSRVSRLRESWKETGASECLGDHVKRLGDAAVLSLLSDGVQEP